MPTRKSAKASLQLARSFDLFAKSILNKKEESLWGLFFVPGNAWLWYNEDNAY